MASSTKSITATSPVYQPPMAKTLMPTSSASTTPCSTLRASASRSSIASTTTTINWLSYHPAPPTPTPKSGPPQISKSNTSTQKSSVPHYNCCRGMASHARSVAQFEKLLG